ncbi:hypothetical protein [Rothia aerolata]|uniref:PqqD family peptide modification chaperone n=1 Tax=Rothia aerolata TaxID=1812262 RepID=A0A917ISY2_9MICC|nr:hypothetical protein [Rothia aerolata]GGH62404.1 hypothetical protein GCM10007359_12570 [Rothia aerolata]
MFRGLALSPAGVEVNIAFDTGISADLVEAVRLSWASMKPREIELDSPAGQPRTILLTDRNLSEVLAEFGRQGSYTPHLVHVRSAARAQERLTVEVTLRLLEALAGKLSLFHAAALGDSASRAAMILIGPSGRGKTTAARFLGRHFAYLSDETAVVQPNHTVRPYPKPLSVIDNPHQPKVQYDPAAAGLSPAAPDDFSYTLRRIILLDRREEPVEAHLEPVALADALLEIVEQTSGLVKTEDGVGKLIALIEACGGVQRLTYHEIHQALDLLRENLQKPTLAQAFPVKYFAPTEAGSLQRGQLHRAPAASGFLMDERLLILQDSQFFELSPFAADCWLAAGQAVSLGELKVQLEKIYGPIPGEDFSRVIEQMVEARVLQQAA